MLKAEETYNVCDFCGKELHGSEVFVYDTENGGELQYEIHQICLLNFINKYIDKENAYIQRRGGE